MKYCSVLQMYFRCAVQPSGVRLMMVFTFAGDLVTKLGCLRHCSIKLYFVKAAAAVDTAAAADVVNVIFQRLLQIYTKSKQRAVFMNANLHAD